MGSQLSIESPNFDRIRKLDGVAIVDAIRLLWFVANNAADVERRDIQLVRNAISMASLSDAPSVQQNNYDLRGTGVVVFTSAGAFTLTGLRNGAQGNLRIIANLGAGTVTVAHESASSDAANRFSLAAGANKAVATSKFLVVQYLNGRWREVSLA